MECLFGRIKEPITLVTVDVEIRSRGLATDTHMKINWTIRKTDFVSIPANRIISLVLAATSD